MVVRATEGRLHGGLDIAARLAGVRQRRLAAKAARTWPRRAPDRARDFLRRHGGLHLRESTLEIDLNDGVPFRPIQLTALDPKDITYADST
jgi:hypothetical protein